MHRPRPRTPATLIASLTILALAPAAPAQEVAERAVEPDSGTALTATLHDVRALLRRDDDDRHLWVGGRLALDATRYGHANEKTDSGSLRAARIDLHGLDGKWEFLVEADVKGTDSRSNLGAAWLAYTVDERLRVRAGQIRQAMNSEYASQPEDLPLPGHSFSSYASGRHGPGVAVDGAFWDEHLRYELSATFGHAYDAEGEHLDSDLYMGRVVARPFRGVFDGADPWRSFGAGFYAAFALSVRDDYDDPFVLATPLESVTFRTDELGGDGGNRWMWEFGWSGGLWRLAVERTEGEAENVPVPGGEEDLDQLNAWSAYATLSLTGGRPVAERGRWRTERGEAGAEGLFRDAGSCWGDWELSSRYSNQDMDRELFDAGIVTPGLATQEARTWSIALAWRPDDVTRLSLGYVQTIADEDLDTFGGTKRDRSVVLRLEVSF